ncbi:ImmA/IrrE family metallo-endopeptidase [Actinomadura sp. LOL_016]|uniref:ImmA/IrrE family metallo-endopeptidase n=1 Tax=unclassified Actinomadura TaxID=2626254 RepID=UPI003A812179
MTLGGDPHEREADEFARDLLIPPKEAARLPSLRTLSAIERFAAEIDIAPGIVVGRMQREGLLSYRFGNRLKEDIELDAASD